MFSWKVSSTSSDFKTWRIWWLHLLLLNQRAYLPYTSQYFFRIMTVIVWPSRILRRPWHCSILSTIRIAHVHVKKEMLYLCLGTELQVESYGIDMKIQYWISEKVSNGEGKKFRNKLCNTNKLSPCWFKWFWFGHLFKTPIFVSLAAEEGHFRIKKKKFWSGKSLSK